MQELFDSRQPLPAVHQVSHDTKFFQLVIALLYKHFSTDRLAPIYDSI